jgi:hypothetical protein
MKINLPDLARGQAEAIGQLAECPPLQFCRSIIAFQERRSIRERGLQAACRAAAFLQGRVSGIDVDGLEPPLAGHLNAATQLSHCGHS